MRKKIKILIITYHPWRDDISVGNTLSNIFNGMEDKLEFASIYIRDDKPCNKFVKYYFNISEKGLLKSIFTHKPIGEEFTAVNDNTQKENFSKSYNKARQLRWDSLLLIQDMIGLLGCWKSKSLDKFVTDYNPDLIFGPLGRIPICNNIMVYLSKKYNIPLVTYPWDDHYSLRKKSWSPIFWLKLFVERYAIKKCANQSKYLYTITSLMKEEYTKYFNKECKMLYKGFTFSEKPVFKPTNNILKLIYMGNIGSGRWKILTKVANAINEINQSKKRVEMYIYTLSPKSNKIVSALNVGDSHLMEPVPDSKKMSTLSSADVLLHVEPLTTKDRLFFRLSFSTKLVDYFYNAKCILALGGYTASMKYLQENDAAIIELDKNKIKERIVELLDNPQLIEDYSNKAWNCGMRNHQIKNIQDGLYKDFVNIINSHEYKQIKSEN